VAKNSDLTLLIDIGPKANDVNVFLLLS